MLHDYHDAFICDMAEYYHIYDYRAYPARYIATLAAGLKPESRVCMAQNGQQPVDIYTLIGIIADTLTMTAGGDAWVLDHMVDGEDPEETNTSEKQQFDSGADFLAARQKALEKINGSEFR